MTDNATQPMIGGNILSKRTYIHEPQAKASLAEPKSRPIRNDKNTVFFII